MKQKKVRDLMIPIDDYAKVGANDSLKDAVQELERVHQKYSDLHYKHRALLVMDGDKVIGKLSMHDVIVGLEPAYRQLGDYRAFQSSGMSTEFLKSIRESYQMWDHPMENICEKAAAQKVGDIMYTPTDAEHVEAEAPLDEAVHQMVIGSHQSLLVTDGEKIVGILRLTDIFHEVALAIRNCSTDTSEK
jgi:CBS domain-containing protein